MTDATEHRGPPDAAASVAAAACVAGLTVAVQLPIFDRTFSAMDEGHMLLFADLVTQGQQLYRDMTIYPLPGAFYLLAAAFEAFGASIWVARCLVVVEFALLVALSFAVLRRIVSLPYACAAVAALWLYRVWAFPHWQIYSYSSTALVLLFGSIATLIAYFGSQRRATLWAAGLLYGLGVFCKQDYGAAAGLAAAFALCLNGAAQHRRARDLLHFFGPAAGVGALAGLHFWLQGQLDFVVQMTVLKHFVGLSTYDYQAFPPLLPIAPDPLLRSPAGVFNFVPPIVTTVAGDRVLRSPWFTGTWAYELGAKAFIYAPIPLVLWGLVRCYLRRARLRDPRTRVAYLAESTLAALAAALVALAHTYRPQDFVHFAVLYWTVVLLAVVLLHSGLSGRPRLAACVAVLAALPAAAFAAATLWLAVEMRELFDTPLPGERAGVYARAEQAELFGDLVDYVQAHTQPDEPVAVLPYFSLVHFLAKRHGPHAAAYILWPFPEYPDRDARIVAAMEALGTQSVIYNHSQFPNFPPVPEYAPALFAYLVDHYETARVFGDDPLGLKVVALRRSEAAPAAEPLEPGAARVLLESPDGRRRSLPPPAAKRFFAVASWPFRPVWALRPSANGRTVLDVAVDVPRGASLTTAIGVHPDAWTGYPASWVRFSIRAVDGDRVAPVFERTLSPQSAVADRGWFDVDAPLDAFANRRITLEFATETEHATGQLLEMGGFGAPALRIGSRP